MTRTTPRRLLLLALLAAGPLVLWACEGTPPSRPIPTVARPPMRYPVARRDVVIEDYHGTPVADPYRWLEDPDSAETRAWVEAPGAAVPEPTWRGCPQREAMRARLSGCGTTRSSACPSSEGGRYFFTLQRRPAEPVACCTWSMAQGQQARLLLDPNTLSADGTVALAGYGRQRGRPAAGLRVWPRPAPTGTVAGARRRERAGPRRQPALGQVLGRLVDADGQGLLLQPLRRAQGGRGAAGARTTTRSSTIHRSARRRPRTCWSTSGPTRRSGASAARSPRTAATWCITRLAGHRAAEPRLLRSDLCEALRAGRADGGRAARRVRRGLRLRRQRRARVLLPDRPGRAARARDRDRRRAVPPARRWKTIIPEADETLLQAVDVVVGDRFVAALPAGRPHAGAGLRPRRAATSRDVELPGLGTAGGFGGKRDDRETFYVLHQLHHPGERLPLRRRDRRHGAGLPPGQVDFDPDDYETEQVFYTARTAPACPMFLAHQQGPRRWTATTRRCSTATAASTSR